MENSVKSLFTWAPNSKTTGRFLRFELKADLFHSWASEEEGAEQSLWWRLKVSPQNCLRLQRQVRFRYHEVCVLWEYHLGVGAAPCRHQQGAEQPTKGVQGPRTARDLKVKTCGRKKMTTSEKQALHNSLPNRKAAFTFLTWKTLASSHLKQIPKAEVQEGQWFLLMVVWFFSTKAGRKQGFNTWVQTHSGATGPRRREKRQGSKPRAEFSTVPWFLTWVDF